MRTWLAATGWRLLTALQLPRDAVVSYENLTERARLDLRVSTLVASTSGYRTLEDLGNTAELQAGERIIPNIADLDVPLVMGNRLREPIIKAIQEAAKVSWDLKLKGWVEDEYVPWPARELERLESFCCNRYKLRIPADEDTSETVANRLERQLNKHCIGFENIMKTETRKGETAGT